MITIRIERSLVNVMSCDGNDLWHATPHYLREMSKWKYRQTWWIEMEYVLREHLSDALDALYSLAWDELPD